MKADANNEPQPARDWLHPLRYLWRVPLLLLLVLITFPIALAAFNPRGARTHVRGERFDHWLQGGWSGALVRTFGFRIRHVGEPLPGAVMFVANHVSWLDINLMHSQRIMAFVAKAEIARWPLVGWLAAGAGTIFHARGSSHSLAAVMQRMVARLGEGMAIGVFPEGGSGAGDRVKTFHARIFQVAADANVPVQPVALCYGKNGKMDLRVPFGERESFGANFLRLLGGPALEAEVHFLEPISLGDEGRRQVAETARTRIAAALGYS